MFPGSLGPFPVTPASRSGCGVPPAQAPQGSLSAGRSRGSWNPSLGLCGPVGFSLPQVGATGGLHMPCRTRARFPFIVLNVNPPPGLENPVGPVRAGEGPLLCAELCMTVAAAELRMVLHCVLLEDKDFTEQSWVSRLIVECREIEGVQ